MTNDNIKFEVSEDGNNFKWTYTQNNIDFSRKRIELDFRLGRLHSVYDGWSLYSDPKTSSISKDQAVNLALSAAENYTLNFTQRTPIYGSGNNVIGYNETKLTVKPDLTNVTTQTWFGTEMRDKPGTLYPLWTIKFTFEKQSTIF
ncbi:MAG: hypothetical protein NWE98_10240 [Candidatus Bathyarchaeota archaeon]|nr:hypothetical protein [Candidatus Bathyarchaeota archaeon]